MLQKNSSYLFYTKLQIENDTIIQLSLKRLLVARGLTPYGEGRGRWKVGGCRDHYLDQSLIHWWHTVVLQGTLGHTD